MRKVLKSIVFLKVRMRICDAGASRNLAQPGADRARTDDRLVP